MGNEQFFVSYSPTPLLPYSPTSLLRSSQFAIIAIAFASEEIE